MVFRLFLHCLREQINNQEPKTEKIGVYRCECAELCGKDHAFMPIVVNVVSAEDYKKWVDGKKKEMVALADDPTKTYTLDELVSRGEKVYAANCAVCHQPNGNGAGAFPALDGSKIVNGPDAAQMHILLEGKNNIMPSWKALSDVELASVMTFTRNSWEGGGAGNNASTPAAESK
ncbi:hypothetical protein ACTFIZ_007543 [Dictyostelium cf. discoideum]